MKVFIKFIEKYSVDLKVYKVVDEINDELLKSQRIPDLKKYSKRND